MLRIEDPIGVGPLAETWKELIQFTQNIKLDRLREVTPRPMWKELVACNN